MGTFKKRYFTFHYKFLYMESSSTLPKNCSLKLNLSSACEQRSQWCDRFPGSAVALPKSAEMKKQQHGRLTRGG